MLDTTSPAFDIDFFEDPHPALRDSLNRQVSQFAIVLTLSQFPTTDSHRFRCVEILHTELYNLFIRLGLLRNQIKYKQFDFRNKKENPDREKPWFELQYVEPGNEFSISLSDAELSIKADKLTVKSLVTLAARVFQHVLATIADAAVTDLLATDTRTIGVEYRFLSKFRMGKDLIQAAPIKNHQVIRRALNLDRKIDSSSVRSESNAFPSLGPEEFVRLDYSQQAVKTINNIRYNMKIVVEAPYNQSNSILYVKMYLHSEEDFDFDLTGAMNVCNPFVHFFKDIIIKRFLHNLLCSVDYVAID